MKIDEIKYTTPLSDILDSTVVEDKVDSLKDAVIKVCRSRYGVIGSNLQSGNLSKDNIIDGKPLFYDEASQCHMEYSNVIDEITGFASTTMIHASQREVSELDKLRSKLFERNDDIEKNIATLNSNYEKGDQKQKDADYDNYYGKGGHVTVAKAELEENKEKIYKINVRLSKVQGGSKAYSDATDGDKKKISIQNAIGVKDSKWTKQKPEAGQSESLEIYTYTTADGVEFTKFVKNGHVAYYMTLDKDNNPIFFNSSGSEISYDDASALDVCTNLNVNGANDSKWVKDGNNYYCQGRMGGVDVSATVGSKGKVLYYVCSVNDKRVYYDGNFNKISLGEAERISSKNNIPLCNPDTYEPTQPTCDPTEPPTEATEPATEPTEPTEPVTEPAESSDNSWSLEKYL